MVKKLKVEKLRPRCFFDITIGGENGGRVIFELFHDICPKTCENFRALCTGEKGLGKLTGKPLHYKGTVFHRVVKGFMVQTGDFSHGNGKGGESIYGGTFEDESFELKHDKPMLLSMANRGKGSGNGSQFFITLAPAKHLDGVHVVFGHVISGFEVIDKIGSQKVDKNDRPVLEIRIANCGELIPQIKSKKQDKSDSESDSSSENDSSDTSDSDSSQSESSRKKTKKSDEGESEKEEGEVADSGPKVNVVHPFNIAKYNVKINPDEIPEVPQNRFLSRYTNQSKGETESGRREERQRNPYIRRYDSSKSGRKIKGRGFVRYRTPSPEDRRRFRRSETPPHWRSEQAKLKPFKEVVAESKAKQEVKDNSEHNSGDKDRSTSDSRPAYGRRYGYQSRNNQSSRSRSRERDSRRNTTSFKRGYFNSNSRNRRSRSVSNDRNEGLGRKNSTAKSRNRSRSSSEEARKRMMLEEVSGDEHLSKNIVKHVDSNRRTSEERHQKDSTPSKHRKDKSRSRSKDKDIGDDSAKEPNGFKQSDYYKKSDRESRRFFGKERDVRSSSRTLSPEARKKPSLHHSKRDRRSVERHRRRDSSPRKRDHSPEGRQHLARDRSHEKHYGTNGQSTLNVKKS